MKIKRGINIIFGNWGAHSLRRILGYGVDFNKQDKQTEKLKTVVVWA